MKPDLTVEASNGAEIFLSKVDVVAQEFLDQYGPPEGEGMKGETFIALLSTIYTNVFAPDSNPQMYEQNCYQNVRQKSVLDYNNIGMLDRVFVKFVSLCAACGQTPTINGFCVFCGVDRSTLQDWKNGTRRNNSIAHSHTVKRWYALCESALAQRAISSNSIGAIFALKSCYAWRETQPAPVPETLPQTEASPQEIMERYKTAALPEVPDDI